MNDIVVALLSFLGMVIGSVVSIVTSSRLTTYKIDELTKIVEKHNSLIERTYHLEQTTAVLDERVGAIDRRVESIEKGL